MALIRKEVKRVSPPHEPAAWFDMRVPLTAADMSEMGDASNLALVKFDAVKRSLVAWSYPDPVTTENVGALDITTFSWLTDQVFEAAALRPEDEKNAFGSNSAATTVPEMEPSLVSSGT